MEPNQVDALAKLVGSGQSRRRILKTLAGGALASIGAAFNLGGAGAAKLRSVGNNCTANNDCASGLCARETRTRKICHCQRIGDCPAGDACHTAACANGACTSAPVNCDDGNACTIDSCDPQTGCTHAPAVCNDGNPCTVDTCDSTLGCVFTQKNCGDNNVCTTDSCDVSTGNCINTPIDCDDQNACTFDSCDVERGCMHTPISCDDHNACTVDTCDQQTGCVHTPVICPSGQTCDSVNGCTCGGSPCGSGHVCLHGGCFLLDPTGSSQVCIDACGPSNIADFGNGVVVCIAPAGSPPTCSSDGDCPSGQACYVGVYCISPC